MIKLEIEIVRHVPNPNQNRRFVIESSWIRKDSVVNYYTDNSASMAFIITIDAFISIKRSVAQGLN